MNVTTPEVVSWWQAVQPTEKFGITPFLQQHKVLQRPAAHNVRYSAALEVRAHIVKMRHCLRRQHAYILRLILNGVVMEYLTCLAVTKTTRAPVSVLLTLH